MKPSLPLLPGIIFMPVNPKITRLFCVILCLPVFCLFNKSFAQSAGFNSTYIELEVNGINVYYDLQANTANIDFQGANLGSFCPTGSLKFKGGENNVYKCGGCDLTSTRIYYRIYPENSSPDGVPFVSNPLNYNLGSANGCGGEDQQWEKLDYNPDLLNNLLAGTYTLEVYSDASTTCSGTVYASNNSNNFKASFTLNQSAARAGEINGPSTLCLNTPFEYYIANSTSPGTWSSTNEAVAKIEYNTQGFVVPVSLGSFDLVRTATGCGGNSTATKTITIVDPGVSAGTITGPTSVCENNTQVFTVNGATPGGQFTAFWYELGQGGSYSHTLDPATGEFKTLCDPCVPSAVFSMRYNVVSPACGLNISSDEYYFEVLECFNQWSGTGDWKTDANWSNGHSPLPNENIGIVSGTPTLTNDFTLPAGRKFTIGSGGGLEIGPKSTLTLAGTFDFANRPVRVISDATGTGSIGEISGEARSTPQNVTVERYIPTAKRAWRLLSIPTRKQVGSFIIRRSPIAESWGAYPAAPRLSSSGTSGQPANDGTLITGELYATSAEANAAGFDWWQAGSSSSVRSYSNTGPGTGVWNPVTNVLGNPNDIAAYMLFIRGDRKTTGGAGSTTLRPRGSISTGRYNATINASQSHVLVPNRFPSAIDFERIYANYDINNETYNASLIKEQFWIWDATYGTYGGYKLVKKIGGNWMAVPFPFIGSGASGNYQYIQSGEAFFVEPLAAGSIVIEQNDKVSPATLPVIMDAPVSQSILYTNLNNGSDQTLVDGVAGMFADGYTNLDSDNDDVRKIDPAFNSTAISIKRAGKRFTIDASPSITGADTLFYEMANLAKQNYSLQFKAVNMQPGLTAYLQDTYAGKATEVKMDDNAITTYNFTVSTDAASAAADRFRVVFKAGQTLPLTLTNVKASQQGSGVQVEWKAVNEKNLRSYEVEKSTDGRSFVKATTVAAQNAAAAVYTWLDATPLKGNNFYRVKAIDNNGTISYSQVLLVNLSSGKSGFTLFPNPVKGRNVSVQFSNMEKGQYSLQVFNSIGQKVYSSSINHMGGSSSEEINLGNSIAAGVYRISLVNNNGSSQNQVLVLQ